MKLRWFLSAHDSVDKMISNATSDEALEINNIFLRPLTPLGMADSSWENIGYTAEEFMDFYRKAFEYIMELNLNGIYFSELHASYFLKKIFYNYSDEFQLKMHNIERNIL